MLWGVGFCPPFQRNIDIYGCKRLSKCGKESSGGTDLVVFPTEEYFEHDIFQHFNVIYRAIPALAVVLSNDERRLPIYLSEVPRLRFELGAFHRVHN